MSKHAKAIAATSALLLTLLLSVTLASATAPVVTIEAAAEVGFTTAKAQGEVNPGEKETSYRFEYITDAQFDQNEAESLPGFEGAAQVGHGGFTQEEAEGIAGAVPVGPAILEGLDAATEYHLRLLAENEDGAESAATTFTTQTATAPSLAVEPASAVSFTEAHIEGAVDPEGGNVNPIGPSPVPIAWELQINREGEGWETAESATIEGAEAESTSPITVQKDLEGLQNGAGYKFRLRATYAGQEATSGEEEFETLAVTAPDVSIEPVSGITGTEADFSGFVNPNAPGEAPQDPAFDSSWHFDCVPDCGHLSGPAIAADDDPNPVSAEAGGLQPNTDYTVTPARLQPRWRDHRAGNLQNRSSGAGDRRAAEHAALRYECPHPRRRQPAQLDPHRLPLRLGYRRRLRPQRAVRSDAERRQ